MEVKLLLLHKGEIRKFPLKNGKLSIGRAPDSDLRIPSRDVSRTHCEFLLDAGDLIVHDTGSTNGTLVNGAAVDETELRAGDVVEVGPATFVVQIDGEPANPKASDFVPKVGAKPAKAAPAAAKPAAAATQDASEAKPAADKPAAAKPTPAKPAPAATNDDDLPPGLLEDDEDTEELLDLGELDLELDELDDEPPKGGKKK